MSARKIENYQITLMPQSKLGPKKLVGEVLYKDENEKFYIPIYWHDEHMRQVREKNIVTTYYEDSDETIIYMSKVFLDLLHKNDMFIGALWHEVGHIHYGHLAMMHNQEELRRIRNDGMIGGGVSKFELEADYFAVLYMGKNKIIRLFEYFRNARGKSDGKYGQAVEEFNRRINHVKRARI